MEDRRIYSAPYPGEKGATLASSSSVFSSESSGHGLSVSPSKDLAGVAVTLTRAVVSRAAQAAEARQEDRRRSVRLSTGGSQVSPGHGMVVWALLVAGSGDA